MRNLKITYILTYAYTSENERYLIQSSFDGQNKNSCMNVTMVGSNVNYLYKEFKTGKIAVSDTPVIQLSPMDYDYFSEKQFTFPMQQVLQLNNLDYKKIKGFIDVTLIHTNGHLSDYYYHRTGENLHYVFPSLEDVMVDIEKFSEDICKYSKATVNIH